MLPPFSILLTHIKNNFRHISPSFTKSYHFLLIFILLLPLFNSSYHLPLNVITLHQFLPSFSLLLSIFILLLPTFITFYHLPINFITFHKFFTNFFSIFTNLSHLPPIFTTFHQLLPTSHQLLAKFYWPYQFLNY